MQTGISSICGGSGCFGPEGILLEACASAGAGCAPVVVPVQLI